MRAVGTKASWDRHLKEHDNTKQISRKLSQQSLTLILVAIILCPMGSKIRLDQLLVERDLADNRSQAQALVLAGQVRVNGQVAPKPGAKVPIDIQVTVDQALPYVSRGGFKLAAALDAFHLSVANAICADVGASTGGFTDCLLQRGAARVYAVDVGYGQLAWKLRQDERVVVHGKDERPLFGVVAGVGRDRYH